MLECIPRYELWRGQKLDAGIVFRAGASRTGLGLYKAIGESSYKQIWCQLWVESERSEEYTYTPVFAMRYPLPSSKKAMADAASWSYNFRTMSQNKPLWFIIDAVCSIVLSVAQGKDTW